MRHENDAVGLMDRPVRQTHGSITSGGSGYRTSVERFGIDEANLGVRRDFIRLGEEERILLMSLIPWARSVAAEIARDTQNATYKLNRW
jgi:hypothetical protein